jgi:hypothetical protein
MKFVVTFRRHAPWLATSSGLGVTLKCLCQETSTHYEFLRPEDLHYMKGVEKEVVKGLKASSDWYNENLRKFSPAGLIPCESCGWCILSEFTLYSCGVAVALTGSPRALRTDAMNLCAAGIPGGAGLGAGRRVHLV